MAALTLDENQQPQIVSETAGALGNIGQSAAKTPTNSLGLDDTTLSALGGIDKVTAAVTLAEKLAGPEEKFDPALAALLYFTKMGEIASKPGATLLGSVAGAGVAPAQYLMQKRKEERDRRAKVGPLAISLAGTLAKSPGKSTLYDIDGKKVRLTDAQVGSLSQENRNKLMEIKPKGAGTRIERNRDFIIRVAPKIRNKTATTAEIQEYGINYIDLINPKTSTEQTADGRTVTRKEPGIDLTLIEKLPIPKDFDPKKVLDEKSREFGSLGTNATFAQRMLYNEGIVRDVLEDGYELNFQDVTADNFSGWFGSTMLTPAGQRFYSSSRNFIAAVLRKESGAAISDGEYINGLKQYFPQVGDTPQVMEDKQALREAAITGMVRESGDAFQAIYPDAVPFLKSKVGDQEFDIINPRGYSSLALGKVRKGRALYFESGLESSTLEELKKMLGDGAERYTDPQLRAIDAEIEKRKKELSQ